MHPQVSSMLVPHVLSVATGEPSNQEVCTKNDRPTSVLTYDIMSVGYRSHLGRLHHHLKSLQFVDDMLILSYTVNLRRFLVFSGTPVG